MKKLNKNKAELVKLFRKNIFFRATIKEISIKLKKLYSGTYKITTELEKDNITFY